MLIRVALVETQYYECHFFVGKIQAATKSHLISLSECLHEAAGAFNSLFMLSYLKSVYKNDRMISFHSSVFSLKIQVLRFQFNTFKTL